jgi:hypothetical protein
LDVKKRFSEKQMPDRTHRQARTTGIAVESVSGIAGAKNIPVSIKSLEASVVGFQKSGRKLLLNEVRRWSAITNCACSVEAHQRLFGAVL